MTVKDVCERLDISRWTVTRAIESNQLDGAFKVKSGRGGSGGTWRIPVASYRHWVDTHGCFDRKPQQSNAGGE